jgi:hypothetical protein
MRWYHAVIIAVGFAVGGICSGGLYRVQVVAHEGEVVLVVRANRLTGRVDYVGLYGIVLKEFKDGDFRGRLW